MVAVCDESDQGSKAATTPPKVVEAVAVVAATAVSASTVAALTGTAPPQDPTAPGATATHCGAVAEAVAVGQAVAAARDQAPPNPLRMLDTVAQRSPSRTGRRSRRDP